MNHIEFFIQQVEIKTGMKFMPVRGAQYKSIRAAVLFVIWRMNGGCLSTNRWHRYLSISYTGAWFDIKRWRGYESVNDPTFIKLYSELSSLYLRSTYSWLKSIK